MKKRIMKIMLALITCATMSLNYIPVAAATGETFNVSLNSQDVTFKIIEDGKVQLGTGVDTGANTTFTGVLTIPETVEHAGKAYEVVKVANYAFSDSGSENSKITSVIGNSITSIGDRAFKGCTGLTSIELPEVTDIGEYTFFECTKLTNIDLPMVAGIGVSAFLGCIGLTSIDLPMVTDVGGSAFNGCTGLTSIDLPRTTEIRRGVFNGCTGLTSIKLPKATGIWATAFTDCTGLTSIDLPEATDIEEDAFKGCTGLTSIELPKVTRIGDGAFNGCIGLTSIDLPKVTYIGSGAFQGCTELTSIDLPKATTIGNVAFRGCTGLTSISLPKATDIWGWAFEGCTSLSSMVLGITNGSSYTFYDIVNYPTTIYLLDPNVKDVTFDGVSYLSKGIGEIKTYGVSITANPVSVVKELGAEATLTVGATMSMDNPWNTLSYQWEKETNGVWVRLTGKTDKTLTFASLTKEDAGMYRCKVASVIYPSLVETSNAASITVNPTVEESIIAGIEEGTTYTKGVTLDVSVVGAGMDNPTPKEGAIRYQPKSWKVDSNTGTFTNTYTTTIDTSTFTAGNKTMEIIFEQQGYIDGSWVVVTSTMDTKDIHFILVDPVMEKDPEGDKSKTEDPIKKQTNLETGDSIKKQTNPETGDSTNIGYLSLGILISGYILFKKKKVIR